MIAIEQKNNTGKLLVAVMAMVLIVVGCAVAIGDDVSAEGETATYNGQNYTLDAAIAAAQKEATVENPAEITLTAASVISATADGSAVDLTNIVINCGTYGITTSASITNGTFNGTTEQTGNNNMLVLGADNLTISGSVFNVTAATDTTTMPYALNTQYYNATIVGCTFAGATDFGAIHINANESQTDVKVTVDNCEFGETGLIVYKGNTLEIVSSDVNIDFVNRSAGQTDVSTEYITVDEDSNIVRTLLGWQSCLLPASGYDEYGTSTNLVITNEISLGEVSKGTAAPDDNIAITVETGGSVEMTGGSDDLQITVETGGTLTGSDIVAASASVAGTLQATGTSTITTVTQESPSAVIDGVEVTNAAEKMYNLLSNTAASVEGWKYEDGTLTLTDFNTPGYYFYDVDLKKVVLEGSNTITITSEAVVNGNYDNFAAIRGDSTEGLIISGSGTLTVVGDDAITATEEFKTSGIYGITSLHGMTISADVTVDNNVTGTGITAYDIKAGLGTANTMKISGGNVSADVIATTLTVESDATLISDNLTITGASIIGIVIVNDTLTYNGTNPLIVSGAIPVDVAAGYIYLNGADVAGQTANVSKIPVTGETVTGTIANTVEDANQKMETQPDNNKNVTIIATDDFSVTGLTTPGTYTINQTVTGSIVTDGVVIVAPGFNAEFNGVNIQIGSATVEATEDGSIITGTEISGTISAETEDETTTIAAGSTITALNVNGVNTPIVLNGITATSDISITAGSVIMTGEIQLNGEDAGIIDGSDVGDDSNLVFGDAVITGSGTISVNSLTVNGELTLSADVTIKVNAGQTMTVKSTGIVNGDGTILLYGGTLVNNGGTVNVTVESQSAPIVTDSESFAADIEYYSAVILSENVIVNDYLDLSGKTIYLNGHHITIGADADVSFNQVQVLEGGYSTMDVNAGDEPYIMVSGLLTISNSDIYTHVYTQSATVGTIDVAQPKVMDVSNSTVGDLGNVGYGNVLNVLGDFTIATFNSVSVYGTLNVEGSLTVQDNAQIYIYGAGALDVSGTMILDGDLIVKSTASADISGSMTVGSTGVLDSDSEYFMVTGTMAMNGTVSGSIANAGTVTIDGASQGATIYAYDGSATNVSSVEGTLYINDRMAADDVKGTAKGEVLGGNYVTLYNVEDVTVTVAVSSVGSGSQRIYYSVMSVSGNVGAVDTTGSIDIDGSGDSATYDGTIYNSYVDIVETLTIGEGVDLGITGGLVVVSGNVTATATYTSVSVASNATLTVNGMVTVGGRGNSATIGNYGTINATYYAITASSVETGYYAAFDAAIQQVANADDDTVTVMGEQTVGADVTVASGNTVEISRNATLTVNDGVTLTIASGAEVINNSQIVVDGTATFENFSTGYTGRTDGIVADVVVDNTPARTFMSLSAAIDSGMEEITLYKHVTIESDLTIPENVTVKSDRYSVTVEDDVTLTVDGGLELTGNNSKLTLEPADTTATPATEAARLIANGHVTYTYTEGTTGMLLDVAGAHYQTQLNRQTVWMISNVTYASENCHTGTIYITGNVSAGDIEFTVAEDEESLIVYVINIMNSDETVAQNSALTVSSVTLGVGVHLEANNVDSLGTAGTISGSVIVAYGDGTADAQIDLVRASGFCINATTEEDDDGNDVYYANLAGLGAGTVTVTSGTVTAVNGLTVDRTQTNNLSLTIASGASFEVPRSVSVSTSSDVTNPAFTVDGTMNVVGGTAQLGGTVINGTLTITNDEGADGTVNAIGMTVNGTVDVVEVQNRNNSLNVGISNGSTGVLTIGSKPVNLGTAAGAGTVNGAVDIANGYIRAYPGADLSGAHIEWDSVNSESLAQSTEYYVNDTLYMTIYVAPGADMSVYSAINAERFELVGLFNGLNYVDPNDDTGLYIVDHWFTSPTMEGNTAISDDTKVIDTDAVYAYAAPAAIPGTISQGTGLTMYIDGIPANTYISQNGMYLGVGEHTVSYDVHAQYDGSNATITFNGQTVANGGTITVTADMTSFTLSVSGAVPASGGQDINVNVPSQDDGMSLTDILLIVLVILILVMAIIVALRLMRS